MTAFEQLVEDLLDWWPGITDGWSEGALRKISARCAVFDAGSVQLAAKKLREGMQRRGQFRPDPANVLWYLDEYGVPVNRALPRQATFKAVPWGEASKVLHGSYQPLASLVGPTEEEFPE